jgi:hypothetical protein
MKRKAPYIVLLLVVFILYARTLLFGFTYLDDNVLILDNLLFLKNLTNIGKAFSIDVFYVLHSSAIYYRPILTLSLMLDAQISGAHAFFYHFSNIFYHATVVILFYYLLTNILRTSSKFALLAALIFAVHPVNVQAVAWIPGRNDVLLALFSLTMLIALHRLNYLAYFVSLFLALFTKESGLLLIPISIYYLLFITPKSKKALANLFPSWLFLTLLWFFLRNNALSSQGISISEMFITMSKNIQGLFLHLGKIFLPLNLSVLPTLNSQPIIGEICFVLLTILFLICKKKNISVFILGIVIYFGFLLPSFVWPINHQVPDFLEQRQYLPFIGLLISFSQLRIPLKSKYYLWLGYVLILLLSLRSFVYISNFSTPIKFWQDAVTHSPEHPLAHRNLGAMYQLDGKLDLAEKEYKIALNLNPNEPMVHNNLGLIYFQQGKNDLAEHYYLKELEVNPNYDKALYNLGLLYMQEKNYDQAEKYLLQTLQVNPQHADAIKLLANYYQETKQEDKYQGIINYAQKQGLLD